MSGSSPLLGRAVAKNPDVSAKEQSKGTPGIEPLSSPGQESLERFEQLGVRVGLRQEVAALDKHFFQPVGKIAPAGVEHGNRGTLLTNEVSDLDTAFCVVAETYVGKDKVKMTVLGTNERCCFAQ